jgi:cell division cycle 2-like protein
VSEVKTLLLQLAAGLAYIHDRSILHRDLKTSNLLLSSTGTLQIADFGMARFVSSSSHGVQLTPLVVTLWYRAPELLLGATRYTAAVDVWSFGCVFAELLTNAPLVPGSNEVDQLARIFELCGLPSEASWPGFRRLPNAQSLRLPRSPPPTAHGSVLRAKFPLLTTAGSRLLTSILSLNPEARPSAQGLLEDEWWAAEPRPKNRKLFPTFPSKAQGEQRPRRRTPNAPERDTALATTDFSGIFGGGFALKLA